MRQADAQPLGIGQPGGGGAEQGQDVFQRLPTRREGRGGKAPLGCCIADAKLHPKRFGNVARHLDHRRLDQHLRAAGVKLGDQGGNIGLNCRRRAHYDGVGFKRGLYRHIARCRCHRCGWCCDVTGRAILQRGGDRVGDFGPRAADQTAQHISQSRRIGEFQAIDPGHRVDIGNGAARHIHIGNQPRYHPKGRLIRSQEQQVRRSLCRDARPAGPGRGGQHSGNRRTNLNGVGMFQPDGVGFHLTAKVKAACDGFDAGDVFRCVGDDQRICSRHRLDIAEPGHQRAQRHHGGFGGEILQLDQAGDDIQSAGRGGTSDTAPLTDGGKRHHPPDRAGPDGGKALTAENRLIQLPHPLAVQRLR